MSIITCSECQSRVSDCAKACPSCGAPIASKSRTVAVLLAIFLGGIGAHKFYTGHPVLGLIYLAFCWTFIPAILGLLEGIGYLMVSEKLFQEECRA